MTTTPLPQGIGPSQAFVRTVDRLVSEGMERKAAEQHLMSELIAKRPDLVVKMQVEHDAYRAAKKKR